jgi:hypothetical protein
VLNELNVEGIVVYSYAYNKDLIVRIACYRDRNRPAKPTYAEGKDKPDYVNVRFVYGVTKNLSFSDDMHIRVKGYLQSREYNETLIEFLTKAKKNPITSQIDVSVSGGKPDQIMCGRNIVEIVVEDYTIIQQASQPKTEPAARKPVLNPHAGKGPVSTETKNATSVLSPTPSKKDKNRTLRNHRGNSGSTGTTAAKTEPGL